MKVSNTHIRSVAGFVQDKALGAGLVVLLGAGCGHLTAPEAAGAWESALRDAVADDEAVHGAAMAVDAPGLGVQGHWAAGVADESGRKMTAQTPFLSASIGKLLVATAVMGLVKEGALSLDDGLTRWVPPDQVAGLPVVGGDAALSHITVAMLLGHRSGLPDYFSGPSADGAPNVFALLVDEPDRTWTRADMLDYTRAHFAPVGGPGERFMYADTNYDLLGMVLEAVTGRAFFEVVRERVIDRYGMDQTWYHAFEPAPAGAVAPADAWVGGVRVTARPSMSADQAGGGLYTTLADLVTLVRALVDGDPVSFEDFAAPRTENAMHRGIDVSLCTWHIRPGGVVFGLGFLPDMVGHSGATGAWAYYVPAHDAVLVGSVNQADWQEQHVAFLLQDVLPTLGRLAP